MRRWFYRLIASVAILFALGYLALWLLQIYPRRKAHPPLQLAKGVLAIQHARIYISPTDPVIPDGIVLIQDGKIAQVGANIVIPADATLVPCNQCTVTAGFWNSHIHFTQPKWVGSEWKSPATLNAQLADMLTSRGFTTVVDTGSNLGDTLPIRRRIESGELKGPFIYTAGAPLYPPHGIPYYLRDTLPRWMQSFMPQPNTPEEAVKDVRTNLEQGADFTKLFTGSYVARDKILPMPVDIAKAAVDETHRSGRLVFSHPSDMAGTNAAVESGVDVLAHAPDTTDGIGPDVFQKMAAQNMAMIPTLKMFGTTVSKSSRYLDPIYAEVRLFHQLHGQLIFGTDVGYMQDYTTEDEFEALGKSGLTAMDVLAMLTVNPASRFGVLGQKGTLTQGKLADLTILEADPADNLANFSNVQTTIRSGRVIYQK